MAFKVNNVNVSLAKAGSSFGNLTKTHSLGDLLHTIDNPNSDQAAQNGDEFGYTVAISGNRAIVGAYFEDVPYTNSGSAYIFDVGSGALLHTIDNPTTNAGTFDYFGISVAISGNRAIVGAYREDIPYQDSGSVYIFDVNTGALLHTINNPNSDQSTNTLDYFGYSVAISGNRAIAGAHGEDGPYTSTGVAYIFDVNTGALLHTLDNPTTNSGTSDVFGRSVAIDGNRAIVSAALEDFPYSSSGSVYIFDVNTGALLHTIHNPNSDQSTNITDEFGNSVAISGNRAIVGAWKEEGPYTDSGAAYIFDVESGALLHTLDNPTTNAFGADYFGNSVAISGNRAIVGSYREDVPYPDSGSAYIYDVESGALLYTIDNPNSDQSSNPSDYFGISVAISGNRAIVGAYQEDVPYGGSGSAYIFAANDTYKVSDAESFGGFRQESRLLTKLYNGGDVIYTIDNPNSDQTSNPTDYFGRSVAISGNRAIVGAPREDIPYTDSGSAYIFNVETGALLHTIDNPTTNAGTTDYFGRSVGISGNRAIVGAYTEDIPYTDSGSAYIFDVNTGALLHTINNPTTNAGNTDYFGFSVAISGNRAIVGAYREDLPYTDGGSAYIFDVSTGALLHTIDNPNSDQTSNPTDYFGISVAISGNRAIVGAYGEDVPYSSSGSAYIFDVESGALLHTINNPNSDQSTNTDDFFGWSVAISGNRAIAGAYGEDVLYPASGSAYIFDVNTGALLHTIANPTTNSGNTDWFGYSVAIDGNRAIVGAYFEDVPYSASGSAYIFDVESGALLHTIDNPNSDQSTNIDDQFGFSVAISGNRAIVGAYKEDVVTTNSGSAYILAVNDCNALDLLYDGARYGV